MMKSLAESYEFRIDENVLRFDVEPELPAESWPSRRHSRLALLGDEMACRWPSFLEGPPFKRNKELARIFDEANDCAPKPLQLPGVQGLSFQEAVAARRSGDDVISMSHFLPEPKLLPEKRFLFFPQLAKASGSLFLQRRLKTLKPQLHLFGHTHFAWDDDREGVRYVSAPLGSPKEWLQRPRSMRLEGGLPCLLYRGRKSSQKWSKRRRALWSDYYAVQERRPTEALGPWLRLRRSPRPRGATSLKETEETATLFLLWDLKTLTEEQHELLSHLKRASYFNVYNLTLILISYNLI